MTASGIIIATVISFIASATLYSIPAVSALVSRTSTPRPGLPMAAQIGSVALRSLIAACLVAGLLEAADWHGARAGALLGLSLSALPLTLLMGGVVHENTAPSVACVHLIDWIIKLTLIGAAVGHFA